MCMLGQIVILAFDTVRFTYSSYNNMLCLCVRFLVFRTYPVRRWRPHSIPFSLKHTYTHTNMHHLSFNLCPIRVNFLCTAFACVRSFAHAFDRIAPPYIFVAVILSSTRYCTQRFLIGTSDEAWIETYFWQTIVVLTPYCCCCFAAYRTFIYTRKPKQHGRFTTTAAVTVVAAATTASTIAVKPCIDFIFSSINCWFFPFVLYL